MFKSTDICVSKAFYRVGHEKPARRLVDQRGRRSRTLYRKLKQMQMQSTYWLEKVLKMISLYVNALLCTLQHIVINAMQLSGVNSPNWHRWVASRLWQYAAACTKVHWHTRRSFSAPSLISKYFAFAFVLISCTESETYAHVGLRDGGPVFRAPFCTYQYEH